jgi:Winged helix DNA-binding domain
VSERVLTARELNRALLARQLLLERVRQPLPRVIERIGYIQNQWAQQGYIRLWTSVEGFKRDDLTRALHGRTVIQGTLMRETIHLVPRRDYALLAAAIRRSGQEWWRRVNKVTIDMEPFARRAYEFFRGTTRTRKEVEEFLRAHEFPRQSIWGFGHWVNLIRVPPSGTWEQRRAHVFALAEDWIGAIDASEDEGIEHLVRRYLAAFGPATRNDIASWSGIPVTRLKPHLERMQLRRFRDERGKELLDVPRAPLPDPETPAPVRFLPTFDATLLAHARRTGVLDEEYRKVIFNVRAPHGLAPFLVDGRVVGLWKYENERIKLDPFERLSRAARTELAEEAERLAAFHR